MSLALCPKVVSQAPQYFRSPKVQGTCDGCIAHQSVCLVISHDWHAQDSTSAFCGGWQALTHASLGIPFYFSLFVASLLCIYITINKIPAHYIFWSTPQMECRRRRFTPKPLAKWETDPSEILNAICFSPQLFQVTPVKLTTIHLTFSWMSSMETRQPLQHHLQMWKVRLERNYICGHLFSECRFSHMAWPVGAYCPAMLKVKE